MGGLFDGDMVPVVEREVFQKVTVAAVGDQVHYNFLRGDRR